MPVDQVEETIEHATQQLKSELEASGKVIKKWLLVTYDIKGRWEVAGQRTDDYVGNAVRNMFREKLYRFGGRMLNHSTYLVPCVVVPEAVNDLSRAERYIQTFAEESNVQIDVVGMDIANLETAKKWTNEYIDDLEKRLEEMDKNAEIAFEKLIELQNEISDDPKKSLRGIHRIVKGINGQYEEIQGLISRFTDNDPHYQYMLTKIKNTVDGIFATWARIKQMKGIEDV